MVQSPDGGRVSVESVTLSSRDVQRLVTRSTAHGVQVLDFDNHDLPKLTADVLLPGWDDSLCDAEVYFMKEGRKPLSVSELRRIYRLHCGDTKPEKKKGSRRVDDEDEDEDEEAQPLAEAPEAVDDVEEEDEEDGDDDDDDDDDDENGLVAVCDDAVDNVVVEEDDKEDGSMMRE